jgi:hypothetical protein
MEADVEMVVVYPDWPALVVGHPHQLAAKAWNEVEARLDVAVDVLYGGALIL